MSKRNIIHWNRVRDVKSISAVATATALGAGLLPKMPGTWGTLVAVPLAWWASDWQWPLKLVLWITLLAAGTWAAKTLDELMQTGDNQCIVMDEVVGLGITSWTLSQATDGIWAWVAAFVVFRFFDIVKLPPVRQMDNWSKKKAKENTTAARWWGGWGVMGDDVLAGFQGLLVMWILQRLQIFPN